MVGLCARFAGGGWVLLIFGENWELMMIQF